MASLGVSFSELRDPALMKLDDVVTFRNNYAVSGFRVCAVWQSDVYVHDFN